MKYIITLLIAFSFCACPFHELATPDPDWVYNPPTQDSIPQDSIPTQDSMPLQVDTVCTTYDDILSPEFVTVWMEQMHDGVEHYTLYMFPFKDTIFPGDDVEGKVHALFNQYQDYYNTNYSLEVFVNDIDDQIYCLMITGTNDINKFAGKFYLRYFENVRHHFGFTRQMYHSPSLSCAEQYYVTEHYPSVSVLNYRQCPCDSIQHIELAFLVLDTANCKGGKEWFDIGLSQYEMIPLANIKADEAGWYTPTHRPVYPFVVQVKNSNRENVLSLIREGYIVKEIL